MNPLIFVKKHSGIILAVAECAGVFATGYLAAKNAKKAALNKAEYMSWALVGVDQDALSEEEKVQLNKDVKKERLKINLKSHIPTFIAGGVTCGLIIFGTAKSIKTEKNLLAAAMMSETLLEKYEKQVRDRTDPEMAKQIREEVIGEVVAGELDDIHESYSDGAKMRIMDPFTKTIYYATQNELLLAEIEINRCLMNGGGMSLKDYLERFKHEKIKTHLVDPETIGWYMDDEYDWDSSYFGYHCAIKPCWDTDGNYCMTFSHIPMSPSEELY